MRRRAYAIGSQDAYMGRDLGDVAYLAGELGCSERKAARVHDSYSDGWHDAISATTL